MSRLKGSVRTFLAVRGAVFVAAIVVLVLAAAIGGASIARGNNSTSPRPAQLATTDWPVNERGQTYGMIRFGSRVDTYFPPNSRVLVDVGQRTVGAETVLAELP